MERKPRFRLAAWVIALGIIANLPGAAQGPGPHFSDWSEPENLGLPVNSPSNDAGGAVSKDGLSLYFHSNRPGGFGGPDLYVSQRGSLSEPWGCGRRASARLARGPLRQ